MTSGLRRAGGLLLTVAAATTAVTAASRWIRRRYATVTVADVSMLPAVVPGASLLLRRGPHGLCRGRVVVVDRPTSDAGWTDASTAAADLSQADWFVTRVAAVAGEPYPAVMDRPGVVPADHVVVLNDRGHHDDSVRNGPCPVSRVLGVCARLLQPDDVEAALRSSAGDNLDAEA